MSGDHAEDKVNDEGASIGDHQAANASPASLANKILADAQRVSGKHRPSAPPPLTKVQSGPSYAGRYVPPLFIDPRNVTDGIEGFEDHKGYLGCVTDAFSLCHVELKALSDAREQVKRDPSKTEAQQILLVAKEAETLQARISHAMDKARTTLLAAIKHNEETLTKPIKALADNSLSSEIRVFCKNLPDDGKRMSFLDASLKSNDTGTLAAILGAPPFLSGIKDYVQKEYTRMLHEKQQPQIAARIKTMKTALEMVEQRGSPMLTEVERCLGADWGTVQKLRKASSATEAALLLVNAPPVQS